MTEDHKKRLTIEQKDKLEIELYQIFEEINITKLLEDLNKLKDLRKEIEDLHQILELSKCCIEKICNKKSFFCC